MKRKKPAPAEEPTASIRLQSFLARSGVASRRGSEDLIREGRVTVNGRTAEIGTTVDPARDTVRLDRKIVSTLPPEWIALHKPRGYVTTRDDPNDRKTVYDLIPPELHHLFHVGRLDRDSSGLLLLTNDGETANRLLHPRYGTTKEYRADVLGKPANETLRSLVEGVRLDDGIAQVISVEMRGAVDNDVYRLILTMQEGRNREVRRLLEAVGHPVQRLFRRSFGPIEIGSLRPGRWRHLTTQEIESLRPAVRARKTAESRKTQEDSGARRPARGRPKRAVRGEGKPKGDSPRGGAGGGKGAGNSRGGGRKR